MLDDGGGWGLVAVVLVGCALYGAWEQWRDEESVFGVVVCLLIAAGLTYVVVEAVT